MGPRTTRTSPKQASTPLESLSPAERGQVLASLLVAYPELGDEAERIASELLSMVSVESVATEVAAALSHLSLDALAARAGRVRGRAYVHEVEAAWELVEETIEPFRSDLSRRVGLGLADAATNLAIGIVAGLCRVCDAEMGTVLGYAGEDAPVELASQILDHAGELGVTVPESAPARYWPRWSDLL